MKLEVGMYVRTEYGIAKITEYKENKNFDNEFLLDKEIIDTHEDYYSRCLYDYEFYLDQVIKASHNIIDLIEVGDYVNGDLVLFAGATTWDNDGNVLDKQVHINHNGCDWWLREKYIKSIVTKEQFETMAYRIGE